MDRDFLLYIIYIVVFSLTLLGLVTFLYIRYKSTSRRQNGDQQEEVKAGNVSIFFDGANNVIIIPYAKDKYGVGRAVGTPERLNRPFSAQELGEAAKYAMKQCVTGKPCPHEELMSILKYPGWKEFSQGRRNISIHYNEGTGVVINTTTRRVDGSYQFNHFGFERVVESKITDKEFGEVILEMLVRCR